jgi:hypothetical protein
MSLRLKHFLYDKYGGFGDKRIKDISRDYPFKVDDQTDEDTHDLFCGIFVRVKEKDRFELSLTNNAPLNTDIENLIKTKAGKALKTEGKSYIEVELSVKDVEFIKSLSQLIAEIVSSGKHYTNRNWKWLFPRTSATLDRLAKNLVEYNRSR